MDCLFLNYPKCSTCKKAKNWLDENDINYTVQHIKDENPTEEQIRLWHKKSGFPLKKFFNTSGIQYRELQLAKKLPDMSEDEQYKLLATDGMLIKRPIVVREDIVLVGFKENEWEKLK